MLQACIWYVVCKEYTVGTVTAMAMATNIMVPFCKHTTSNTAHMVSATIYAVHIRDFVCRYGANGGYKVVLWGQSRASNRGYPKLGCQGLQTPRCLKRSWGPAQFGNRAGRVCSHFSIIRVHKGMEPTTGSSEPWIQRKHLL